MDLPVQVSARELAIKYGALSLQDLVSWADFELLSNENPDPNFYDMSLSQTMGEALTALNKIKKSDDKVRVSKLAFQYFHHHLKSGKGNYQKIAKALFDMAMHDFIPKKEAASAMYSFWDDLDLAIDGIYGEPEQIKQELIDFLKRYMD